MRLLTVLALLASGCVGLAPVEPAPVASVDGGTVDPQQDEPLSPNGPMGGGDPLYNKKQCQWDACGGPLPIDRSELAKEEGR